MRPILLRCANSRQSLLVGRAGQERCSEASSRSGCLLRRRKSPSKVAITHPSLSARSAKLTVKRISDDQGRIAKLVNAPVLGAIQVETLDLGRGDGTRFADPELRRWER